jgi:hypothetical protein
MTQGAGRCVPETCICLRSVDPHPAIAASEAVFIARALEVSDGNVRLRVNTQNSLPPFLKSVVLVVEHGWKGMPPDTVEASIDLTGPDCPTRFIPGERYLVYAEKREGAYVIGVCTRTAELRSELSQADLRVLGRPSYQRP